VGVGPARLLAGVALGGALDQHLEPLPDPRAVLLERDPLLDVEQDLVAPLLLVLGDVVRERRRVGPGRGEYLKTNEFWNRTRSRRATVWSKSAVDSPGNPTMKSLAISIPGTSWRSVSQISR
jgi:hypothetical protein